MDSSFEEESCFQEIYANSDSYELEVDSLESDFISDTEEDDDEEEVDEEDSDEGEDYYVLSSDEDDENAVNDDEDDDDDCDDDKSDDEIKDQKYLLQITKPYRPYVQKEIEEEKYDEVTPKDWGKLNYWITLKDGYQIAKWFESKNISPKVKENIGKDFSPLNLAARMRSSVMFNFFLGEGFTLNTSVHPFLDAALNHKFDIMETLLYLGSDVNVTNSSGKTALHFAAKQSACKPKKIKYLLSKGAKIDQKDNSGMTPLHYALVTGSTKTAATLVQAGASTLECCGDGRSVLYLAVGCGRNMAFSMYKAGARPGTSKDHSEVTVALKIRDYHLVRFLIQRNAYVAIDRMAIASLSHKLANFVTNLLVGAGYEPKGDDILSWQNYFTYNKNIMKKIKHLTSHPRSLQELACFRVRESLRGSPRTIKEAVEALPVPHNLQDYLLLKHVRGLQT